MNKKLQTRSSNHQQEARLELVKLFEETPIPTEELLVNLPLYMRSSVLAKLLYINELYKMIIRIPGVIMEFGTWWGANLAMFESFRAIYEPYNYTRKVVGFDTFEGYTDISKKDGNDPLVQEGQYKVCDKYFETLSDILDYHQRENVMSHIKKFELCKGDAPVELNKYLKNNPETIISLAYFDLQLYKPTKKCLRQIVPYLTKGSVIAMDELNCKEFPGETKAFKEVIGLTSYRLIRSNFLPDRSYLRLYPSFPKGHAHGTSWYLMHKILFYTVRNLAGICSGILRSPTVK